MLSALAISTVLLTFRTHSAISIAPLICLHSFACTHSPALIRLHSHYSFACTHLLALICIRLHSHYSFVCTHLPLIQVKRLDVMRTQASEQAVQPMSEDQGIPEAGLTSASTQELAKELGVDPSLVGL